MGRGDRPFLSPSFNEEALTCSFLSLSLSLFSLIFVSEPIEGCGQRQAL